MRHLARVHTCAIIARVESGVKRENVKIFTTLENERHEHPAVLHVLLVGGAKKANVLGLLDTCRRHQEKRSRHGQNGAHPGWVLEKHAPRQKEQRAVQRVANVAIDVW